MSLKCHVFIIFFHQTSNVSLRSQCWLVKKWMTVLGSQGLAFPTSRLWWIGLDVDLVTICNFCCNIDRNVLKIARPMNSGGFEKKTIYLVLFVSKANFVHTFRLFYQILFPNVVVGISPLVLVWSSSIALTLIGRMVSSIPLWVRLIVRIWRRINHIDTSLVRWARWWSYQWCSNLIVCEGLRSWGIHLWVSPHMMWSKHPS